MKRKWALLPMLLLMILVLSEVYLSFVRPEEPKEPVEIIIKAAPSLN